MNLMKKKEKKCDEMKEDLDPGGCCGDNDGDVFF